MMNEFEQFCIDWCFDIDDPVARKKFDARIANKERQKIYRKNHRDTKAHINLLIDRETKAIFDNIVNHYGVTKVQFLKSMLEKEENRSYALTSNCLCALGKIMHKTLFLYIMLVNMLINRSCFDGAKRYTIN